MDINTILAYQEVDTGLRKIEVEIERSDDFRIARQAKTEFEQAKHMANACEKKAAEIMAFYAKVNQYYAENHGKVDQILKKLEEMNGEEVDLDALYELKADLEKLTDRFANGEKGLNDITRRMDEIDKTYNDNIKNAFTSKKVFQKSREAYEKLKAEKAPVINELKTKLEAMAKKIDPKLMERYNALRKDKVFPVFVPLEGGVRCGGCRMEQSTGHLSSFTDGMIECESCHRIIYK